MLRLLLLLLLLLLVWCSVDRGGDCRSTCSNLIEFESSLNDCVVSCGS